MAKRKTGPYTRQAQQLSLTRYGPQISALTALMRQAEEDYQTSIRSARSTSDLVSASVDRARPQVVKDYAGAGAAATAAQAATAPDVAARPAGDPFRVAAGLEQAGLSGRLAESQAATLGELAQRRVGATEGAAYAKVAAGRQLRSDRLKIGQQAMDLAGQEGAFTASTITDLLGADAKAKHDAALVTARLTQQERNSIRAAGMNPDQPLPNGGYAPTPGGRLDPKAKGNRGGGWASSSAQSAASDMIQQALHEAKTLRGTGAARHEAAQLLLEGAKETSQPVYRTVTKGGKTTQERVLNPDGTQKTKTIPGLPQIKSQLLLSTALDIAYDGHLSPRNQKLLHDRGIKIGPLGVQTYQEWLKSVRKAAGRIAPRSNAPGANGQSRPT